MRRRWPIKADVEAWVNDFRRRGWTIEPAPEQHPYFDFKATKNERSILVDVRTVIGNRQIHLSQGKYPPNQAWAIAVTWRPDENSERATRALIPGDRWREPGGPFKARPNITSSLCPEWVLDLRDRDRAVIESHGVDRKAAWPEGQRDVLQAMLARPDFWEARGPRAPAITPEALRPKGPDHERPLYKRVINGKLLDRFELYLDDTKQEMTAVIENYMAWLLGVDCHDTPYRIPEALVEVNSRRKHGERLPTYFRDSPP